MKYNPIPRRPVTPQDNRLADISAPEPAWEQHLGVEWHEAECGKWSLNNRALGWAWRIIGGGLLAVGFFAWIS